MVVRYVFKDDRQIGSLYVTSKGVHLIDGPDLYRFLEWLGGVGESEFIIHPEDEEGDRFFELAHPFGNQRVIEGQLEQEMEEHGYTLSPRRF